MSAYLGRGLILTDMTFEYGGRSVTAPVIVDSGAEGFAAIDKPFAEKLGMPLRLAGLTYGVGGSTMAWQGDINKMSFKDVPGCKLENITVGVSDIPLLRPNAVALLGLRFMGETDMLIRFGKESVKMKCGDLGPEVSVPIKALSAPGSGGASSGSGSDAGGLPLGLIAAVAGVGLLLTVGIILIASD
jgi:hypothetical protein